MTQQALKEKLLQTNSFLDNEYLDLYCELIYNNRDTKQEKYRTQSHHIIPQCWYLVNHFKVDNSQENRVNILYKDHILAHYYLCLCTTEDIKYRLANAFFHLVSRRWKYEDFNPETDLSEYQRVYEYWMRCISLRDTKNISEAVRKAQSKQVQNLNTGEVFISASEAERIIKGKVTSNIGASIDECSKGACKKAYGHYWAFLDDNNGLPYNDVERAKMLKVMESREFRGNLNHPLKEPYFALT